MPQSLLNVDDLLKDIAASPTPYHAVNHSLSLLEEVGFALVDPQKQLPNKPGGYMVAVGGTIVAWRQQTRHNSFTVVGAHTDSPNLRVKSRPDMTSAGVELLTMEVYGGILGNSWLNRDLGLAGRVAVRTKKGISQELVMLDRPLLTIPQLAIHLDRDIGIDGLKLNNQKHLIPMWGLAPDNTDLDASDPGLFRLLLAESLGVAEGDILSWDVMAFDLQAPSRFGRSDEFIASARIDNLLSAFCATRALASISANGDDLPTTPVLVLYDHEEVGSASATGADGVFLSSLLERIATAQGADRSEFLTSLNRSIGISADGAHATHPNYVDKHDPNHHIGLNKGIVIKRNANQRYATDAISEAYLMEICQSANVQVQQYIHRNDMRCGSTIGPIAAAQLGMATVDVGAPQLSMHSIRETAGTTDAVDLTHVLKAAWQASGLQTDG